ncbi:hypothetical protein pclt_cds_649 [Pandoravirus celtis]|uniref:Uncharacterized protein n=1 Tax=Pandoravirus celtis TaxID=2568002 RepID=A0A4D6EHF5_9VIRU|nr:hypothetical protein pclt_cds_649 [Pandoravirus celtis]
MQKPNKYGWFSAQDAKREGYFSIWATPDGGRVTVTAVLKCDACATRRTTTRRIHGTCDQRLRTGAHQDGRTSSGTAGSPTSCDGRLGTTIDPRPSLYQSHTRGQPSAWPAYDMEEPTPPPTRDPSAPSAAKIHTSPHQASKPSPPSPCSRRRGNPPMNGALDQLTLARGRCVRATRPQACSSSGGDG